MSYFHFGDDEAAGIAASPLTGKRPQVLDLSGSPDWVDALRRKQAALIERETLLSDRARKADHREAALGEWSRWLVLWTISVVIGASWVMIAAQNLTK